MYSPGPAYIAPCGMNCSLCSSFQREKEKCPGCRQTGIESRRCIIIKCTFMPAGGFCGDSCGKFPCRRLRQLDERYRTRYGMSMLENLASMEEIGVARFAETESEKWKCKSCGSQLCVHRPKCNICRAENQYYPKKIQNG